MKDRPLSTEEIHSAIFIVVSAIILILCSANFLSPGTSPEPLPIEQAAWNACVWWVEQVPKVPASEAQDYTPVGVTFVEEFSQRKYLRYLAHVYYPDRGDIYHCDIRLKGPEGWHPISITVTFG